MKKIISIFLTLVFILLASTQLVSAESFTSSNLYSFLNSNELTEEISADIALNHMRDILDDNSIEISNIEKLFDLENNVTGYCISFDKVYNNTVTPSGYVLISKLEKENPIVEFSTEGESIENTLTTFTENSINQNTCSITDKIYFLGSGKIYSEYIENGKQKLFDPNQKISFLKSSYLSTAKSIIRDKIKSLLNTQNIKINDFNNTCKSTIGGGMTNEPTGGVNKRSNRIPGINVSLFKKMNELSSGGVCSPTAATNLMIYYKNAKQKSKILIDNSAQKTFNKFYSLMKTSKSSGTLCKNIAPAYKSYIKSRGYTSGVKVDSYFFNFWSDFTRDINSGIPIHTDLQADDGGHSVVTVGWYIKRYGKKDYKYLQVINGWTRNIQYVSFNGYYKSISGIAVKI
ncbi:MAG: C39 family peptidase [Ruminococcus sp.]